MAPGSLRSRLPRVSSGACPRRVIKSRAPPRGWPRTEHLGRLLPAARAHQKWRYWRHCLRSLPSLCRRHCADAQSWRQGLSLFGCVAAGDADRRGATNEAGLAFYDRLIDGLLAAGDRALALSLPLGSAAGARRPWRLDQPRMCRLVRRLRHADRAPLRRPGQALCDLQRAFGVHAVWLLLWRDAAGNFRSRQLLSGRSSRESCARRGRRPASRKRADASIGAAHNFQPCRPAREEPEHLLASQKLDAYWNGAFPDPQLLGKYPALLADAMAPHLQPDDLAQICRPVDWFGLNHYSPHYVVADDSNPLGVGFGPRRPASRAQAWAGRSNRMPSAKRWPK